MSKPWRMDRGVEDLDFRVIACNLTEATSAASDGTLAYVLDPNRGNVSNRMRLAIRSRSGRWIEKWERLDRLDNFRFKTLPPEHPLHGWFSGSYKDEWLAEIQRAKEASSEHP